MPMSRGGGPFAAALQPFLGQRKNHRKTVFFCFFAVFSSFLANKSGTSLADEEKSGYCPLDPRNGVCDINLCHSDQSCPDAEKCCPGACGFMACMAPLVAAKRPGSCPPFFHVMSEEDPCLEVIRPVVAPEASDLPTVEPCAIDENCTKAEQKCCDTWCHGFRQCKDPLPPGELTTTSDAVFITGSFTSSPTSSPTSSIPISKPPSIAGQKSTSDNKEELKHRHGKKMGKGLSLAREENKNSSTNLKNKNNTLFLFLILSCYL